MTEYNKLLELADRLINETTTSWNYIHRPVRDFIGYEIKRMHRELINTREEAKKWHSLFIANEAEVKVLKEQLEEERRIKESISLELSMAKIELSICKERLNYLRKLENRLYKELSEKIELYNLYREREDLGIRLS